MALTARRAVRGTATQIPVMEASIRPGRLSGCFPQLHKALWNPETGDLAEHIEGLVNDAVLDITHTLESPLHAGDRLSLIGQYLGG